MWYKNAGADQDHPLDLTFYQTVKGITTAEHIAKAGGRILVLGECSGGIGSPEFARKLKDYPGPQSFLEEIREAEVVIDQWQLEKLALTHLKNQLFFYAPGVSDFQIGCLADRNYPSLDSVIAAVLKGVLPDARVPDGPYVFARVSE